MFSNLWPVPSDIEGAQRDYWIRRLTRVSGIALIVIGAGQGASAVLAGMSVTDPKDFAIRTVVSVILEVGVVAATLRSLRRRHAATEVGA
jgi:hypothetical protein